ncbi:hypothetical protein AQUSIP_11790 [Aquicella siphonis]|uniref:Lipocalin-like domain-containing protein n=1 Tax=Aquicella siphonis TaxID=254247 RepID=A0A5E4PH82_9COXI|nr:hypothetical protein [Aquicella siphonis]VVC75878.1 hypothetical protein AQUSIP_11790 [Aquicella siphonis]
MKKKLITCFTAAIVSFAAASYADITMHSYAANACQKLSGQWAGTGTAKNWMIGQCEYSGSGTASSVDAAGNFTLKFNADKDSGSMLCPKHTSQQMSGKCINGDITINTEYGSLKGSLSEKTGEAKGTLHISPGVQADLTIRIQRTG